LWTATVGRDSVPKPEVHLYLADLHFRLESAYRAVGRWRRARIHRKLGDEHSAAGPTLSPRPSAALAMPVPHAAFFTDARNRSSPNEEPLDIA
jgi:hypothetical protein